jgi:beta-galactosidase
MMAHMRVLPRFLLVACVLPASVLAASTVRLAEGWEYQPGDLGGAAEVWAALPRETLRWQKVSLPHCFNARDSVDPDTPYYQGAGWYRLLLDVTMGRPTDRVLLHFEGAGQKTQVFVHDRPVATHVGGYDEWTVDLTDAIAQFLTRLPTLEKPERFGGRIPLTIRCDNTPDLEAIPSQRSDFVIYGGLYRQANLEIVPAVSLERVHVEAKPDGKGGAEVMVFGRLRDPAKSTATLELSLTVEGPDGAVVARAHARPRVWVGREPIFRVQVPQVRLWSPDDPALYRATVALTGPAGAHEVTERFGVRTFEFVERGPFKLNGERLLLRGTHRHEDGSGVGAALTDEMVRREFALMKAMGVNFIRLGHYQQSRLALELCDELGFIVWEEIPWCRGGIGGERPREQSRVMLEAMIDQHRNHPSIVLWGLGNENDWFGDFETPDQQAQTIAFMKELHALAHRLDPSRVTSIRRCDFCRDIVDVYSPSIWAGWYRGKFVDYKSISERERDRVKHFLHVEWGGDSHAGRHAENPYVVLMNLQGGAGDERTGDYLMTGGEPRVSRDGDWSESYICDLFDWHLKEQETMPWLTGTAQWVFKDFATPLRPENPVPFVNQKGVVERDMTPKESYYVFRSYWTTKPMARIHGHSWPVRWGRAGQARTVKVHSNCATAELFLNGASQGVRTRNSQDFPAAGLRWDLVFRDGANDLRVVARAGDGTEVTDSISLRYETRTWGPPVKLTLTEVARAGGVATLEALALDAKGVVCLDSRATVRFALAGDGRLLDNLGTAGGSRVVQLANGRARISAELRGGSSVVSVASQGVETGFANLAGGR